MKLKFQKCKSQQCCEERDAANTVMKHYVWGLYIDELIQQRNAPDGTPIDYYALSNSMYNVTALTDSSGNIVETYDLDPYGNRLLFTAAGTDTNWFTDDDTQADEGIGNIGGRYGVWYRLLACLRQILQQTLRTPPPC